MPTTFSPSPLSLADEQLNPMALREQLEAFAEHQKQSFLAQQPVEELVLERATFMDELLTRLWQYFELEPLSLSLLAVGGYGRAELHPLSDIDILVLSKRELSSSTKEIISQFITLLWDLRLEVGQSVRTVKECLKLGKEDLTVATNLQEARLICGQQEYCDELIEGIQHKKFWPSEVFYQAKVDEQKERHGRYHNTAYNLEPDIKSSPGGLRDIHTLSWVARRHFGATSLKEMCYAGFLTDAEYRELLECQEFLWRIRFALHSQLKRYDNRLTFDHQAQVAEMLGYQGEGNKAIEQMMKAFYRTLRRVSELNIMLLKLFKLAIIPSEHPDITEFLSADFQRRGNWIEARKPALFQARPETILDMFLHIANDSSITIISPATLRQLRTARRRLNRFLHTIPEAREKFMDLINHPNVLHKAFPLMHRLGVLSAYLPQWSQIVGQMQFDLFHVYTVDEHTMRVLKHIHSFSLPENQTKHPLSYEIYNRMGKKSVLLLAALFHDIAKGRGGDHSDLGAVDAYDFCIEHGLSKPEAKQVSWLVKSHLIMSITAQRRDIYDPDVIAEFAKKVRDESYLENLLCLTVADICATNPELWNSWKRTLLSELFYSTQRALRRGLENPVDVRERIRHNQQVATTMLRKSSLSSGQFVSGQFPSGQFTSEQIDSLWPKFKADYFLRHTPQQIAWHGENLLRHNLNTHNTNANNTNREDSDNSAEQPMVLISNDVSRGGTEIFVYTQDRNRLFAMIVLALDKRNLNIQDAQIMSSRDGYSLDTFMVLDHNDELIEESRHKAIVQQVQTMLEKPNFEPSTQRMPRKLQNFTVKTRLDFIPTKTGKRSLLELVALDCPGLLAHVSLAFAELNLNVHGAKIATIGERVEDLFILTSPTGKRLNEEEEKQATELIKQKIEALYPE